MLVTISILIFSVQRFVKRVFDPVFELCIFHIPTVISVAVYLKLLGRRKG